jgi:hypothetical protein
VGTTEYLLLAAVIVVPLAIAVAVTLWSIDQVRYRPKRGRSVRSVRSAPIGADGATVAGTAPDNPGREHQTDHHSRGSASPREGAPVAAGWGPPSGDDARSVERAARDDTGGESAGTDAGGGGTNGGGGASGSGGRTRD